MSASTATSAATTDGAVVTAVPTAAPAAPRKKAATKVVKERHCCIEACANPGEKNLTDQENIGNYAYLCAAHYSEKCVSYPNHPCGQHPTHLWRGKPLCKGCTLTYVAVRDKNFEQMQSKGQQVTSLKLVPSDPILPTPPSRAPRAKAAGGKKAGSIPLPPTPPAAAPASAEEGDEVGDDGDHHTEDAEEKPAEIEDQPAPPPRSVRPAGKASSTKKTVEKAETPGDVVPEEEDDYDKNKKEAAPAPSPSAPPSVKSPVTKSSSISVAPNSKKANSAKALLASAATSTGRTGLSSATAAKP